MTRPRKILAAPSLSPGKAVYVIERLDANRRLSAAEIHQYVSGTQK